jgi:hypothetical protein
MPSGELAWHYVETHGGGDDPWGPQPQAFGNGAFKELYHSTPEIASNLNANHFLPSAFLPMTLLIGIPDRKHYPQPLGSAVFPIPRRL